jgi:Skp family chaperone for outer membrane proteins
MSLRRLFARIAPLAALFLIPTWDSNAPAEEPSGLLGTLNEERLVIAGKLRAEVENNLATARRTMADDPAHAEQDLKLSLETLDRAPDIDPQLRDRLRRQLQASIRSARQQKVEADQRLAERQAAEAAARVQERLNEHTATHEQKIQQIVDRFNALLQEGRYTVADGEVAPEISRLAPNSTIDASLTLGGQLIRAARDNESVARQRHNNSVRTLASVESAAIPFSDDPPIAYLPLDQWQQITDQREKYKSVDVHKPKSAEQRITSELNNTTNLDVVEMPFKDVVSFLADLHHIPIVLATKKLDEAGVSPDTPVTKTLRGVTLRSALRLLLKDLELSYVIQDEVIQITTPEDASAYLATKVYPVGDLVVPVQPPLNMFTPGGMGPMNGATNTTNGPMNPLNPGMPAVNGARPGFPNAGVNFF